MLSAHAHFRIGFRLPASRGSGRKSGSHRVLRARSARCRPPRFPWWLVRILSADLGPSGGSPLSGPALRPASSRPPARRGANLFSTPKNLAQQPPAPGFCVCGLLLPWVEFLEGSPASSIYCKKTECFTVNQLPAPPGPSSPSAPSRVLVSISSLWFRFETVRDRVRLGSLRPPRVNGLLDRAGR